MDLAADWVPLRWPDEWHDTALLDLLAGTPVNCLLLPWRPPFPSALAEAARRRGLALVAVVDEKTDRAAALASAQSAGLSAVALPEPTSAAGVPIIAWTERPKIPWPSSPAAFAFTDAVWPALPSRAGVSVAEAGPTGTLWVDSNGWFIRLARTLAPGTPVWPAAVPPPADFLRPAAYQLAAADAWAYGGRWPIVFESKLAAALAARHSDALALWSALAGALRFFECHAVWESYSPIGNLAVLSDFAGPNRDTAGELLNLLPRRVVPYRILEKARALRALFDGLEAILYADEQPPEEPLMDRLMAFAGQGGLLLAAGRWPAPAGAVPSPDSYRRWNVYRVGRGRLAIVREPGGDPFLVAADAQALLGHRNDLLRLFNSSALNVYYTESPNGRAAVLHVLNYAQRTWEGPASLALLRPYRSARLWRLDGSEPEPLPLVPNGASRELHLPPFAAYAAIELEV